MFYHIKVFNNSHPAAPKFFCLRKKKLQGFHAKHVFKWLFLSKKEHTKLISSRVRTFLLYFHRQSYPLGFNPDRFFLNRYFFPRWFLPLRVFSTTVIFLPILSPIFVNMEIVWCKFSKGCKQSPSSKEDSAHLFWYVRSKWKVVMINNLFQWTILREELNDGKNINGQEIERKFFFFFGWNRED